MKKAIGLFLLLSMLPITAANAADADSFELLYSETRPIYFTNNDSADSLTVQYLGEDCLSAIAVYTVRRAGDRFPVFTKAQPLNLKDPVSLPEFRHYYENCEARGDHRKGEADWFWGMQADAVVSDTLSFVPPEAEMQIHATEETRKSAGGAHLLCLWGGYESTNCYWYNPREHGAELFLSFGF